MISQISSTTDHDVKLNNVERFYVRDLNHDEVESEKELRGEFSLILIHGRVDEKKNKKKREERGRGGALLRGGLDLTSILGRVHSRPASSRGKCSIITAQLAAASFCHQD